MIAGKSTIQIRHGAESSLRAEFWWKIFLAALAFITVGTRFWALDLKPAHFDEGINGWFADGITKRGYFIYDPTNYHGPWHFYMVWVSQTLFGRSLWALRLPAVLASAAAVFAMLGFSRFFGRLPAALAATAMAMSPAFVFYGRYSIHESWVVLFNILFIIGILGLWQNARRSDVWLICIGIAGLVLNKETYLIQVGSLFLAIPFLWLWNKILPASDALRWQCTGFTWKDWIAPVVVSVFAIAFFYSGTFFYPQGLHGLWKTWAAWVQTGVDSGGHEKSRFDLFGTPLNWYWVWLMARYEWPALLGVAACIGCVARVPQALRLLAIYAIGLLLAYSIIPYKTPWCIIAFLWLFYIVLAALVFRMPRIWRIVFLCLLAISLAVSARRMIFLNFENFDDEREPYVYVQTYRDINRFTEPLILAAAKDPRNYHVRGLVLLASYYPLPWTLGDFPNIAWFGSNWPAKLNADFLVVDESRREEAIKRLQVGEFIEIRFRFRDAQEPSVAFLRRSIYAPFVKAD